MKEVIATFGRNGNLNGIVCTSDQSDTDLMLILLNAGVTHKAGPFRLNVDIARHVAGHNINSFRFDVGGLGDSEKIQSSLTHEAAMMQDIGDALNLLELKYGTKRFIVIGLCTGAEHSHKIALLDDRVIGCVWLDGYGYATPKFYMNRYVPKLLNPLKWLRLIARLLGLNRISGKQNRQELPTALSGNNIDDFVWRQPAINKYIQDMALLFNRGVKCLYIYTGGVYEYYNYADQYKDSFNKHDFMQNITVEYLPLANHTYTLHKDKAILLKKIVDWIKNV